MAHHSYRAKWNTLNAEYANAPFKDLFTYQKNGGDMAKTDEERRAELEEWIKADAAEYTARVQRLKDTGFYEWHGRNDDEHYGDMWLAGYDKALLDEKENQDPRE